MVFYINEGMIDELKDKKTRKKFLKHIDPIRVWSYIIKNRKKNYGKNKKDKFLKEDD